MDDSNRIQADLSNSWLLKSAISLLASKIVASVAILTTGAMLLRYLGPSDYGFYQVVIAIASFTVTMFGLGFSPVIARFVPELLERGNSRTAAKFLLANLALRVTLIAVLVPLGLMFFGSVGHLFGLEELDKFGPLVIVVIVLGAYLGSSVGPVVLGAYARQSEIGVGAVFSAVLRVLVIIIVVTQDYGLIGVLTAIATVEALMTIGYLVRIAIVVRAQTEPANAGSSSLLKKRTVRYLIPNAVLSALSFFEGRFGMVFVITSALGTDAVGNYSFVFVVLQFGAILNPIYTLNTLIDNVIVRQSVHIDQRILLAQGQRIFLIVSVYSGVPVAVYLLVLRAPLSQMFGFEQAGTGWLFLWAGIFFIANSAKLAYGNIFSQLEVPYYKFYFGLIGIVGVGVAFTVIDQYGIQGVAAVAAASSVLGLSVQHLVSKLILKIPVGIYPAVFLKIAVINVLAGAAALAVLNVSDRFVVIALATSAVFVVVYAAATFLLKPFSADDVRLVRSIVPNMKLPFIGSTSK